ncbi:MAG TPA: response regulator [Coleofasciculaceae cyanobacterium]|jgi:CheY-like chemotaxis protein
MSTANPTILLAEDNPDTQFFIQLAIEEANLAVCVQVVKSGQEAKHYLTGENSYADRDRYPLPVLILTNLDMSGLSGIELLEWVKQQPELKQLPVVVISSSDDPYQIKRAMKLGASSYFVKTPTFDSLIDLLMSLIPSLLTPDQET